MSTVDLSALPSPEVLESLDFEDAYQEELGVFRAYMGDNWNAALESDPVVKLLELGAYRRLQTRARINDAAKSLLLAYAQAESPSPAHVVVTVLHLEGNGVADQALLDKVLAHLSDEDIRPVGDRLTVQSAEVLNYRIDAVLHMAGTGSENEAILAEATRRLLAWINPRRRLGVEISRSAIDAQLHITGVSRVDLPGWVDIPRAKHQAAYCIGSHVVQGGAG